MLRIAIIEDEPAAIQLLSSIISEFCDEVEVVGTAQNIEQSIQLIHNTSPDAVFMDIRLGSESSFDLFETISPKHLNIVFTTAYTEYAIDAFGVEAVDYVLKPYSPKAIIKAINKLKKVVSTYPIQDLEKLMNKVQLKSDRISVSTSEGLSFIDQKEIVYCSADGAYCTISSLNDGKIMVSKTLGEIEAQLNPSKFIRIHASHVINIDHIKKFLKDDGGIVLMSDGTQIPVSRRKKQEFLNRITS
jgi:two-component system, LytTR family, response regulator